METLQFLLLLYFPRHIHQPKAIVTRKVDTGLASVNGGLNEWGGIKKGYWRRKSDSSREMWRGLIHAPFVHGVSTANVWLNHSKCERIVWRPVITNELLLIEQWFITFTAPPVTLVLKICSPNHIKVVKVGHVLVELTIIKHYSTKM